MATTLTPPSVPQTNCPAWLIAVERGKVRDRFVGDRGLPSISRAIAQARAQDHAGPGRSIPPRADERSSFGNVRGEVEHRAGGA